MPPPKVSSTAENCEIFDSKSKNCQTENKNKKSENVKIPSTGNFESKTENRFPSIVSIGFAELSKSKEILKNENINDFLFDSKSFELGNKNSLYETCVLSLICAVHRRIAVKKMPNRCYFLPISELNEGKSLSDVFKDLLKSVFVNLNEKFYPPQIVDIWRVKHPKSDSFVTRYIFKTLILFDDDSNMKNQREKCCINTDSIFWLNSEDLKKLLNPMLIMPTDDIYLWGIEPFELLKTTDTHLKEFVFHEFEIEDMLLSLQNEANDSIENQLFKIVNYCESDIKTMFNEYLVHSYPSENMTFQSFCVFAVKLSLCNHFNLNQLRMLFNSFDENRHRVLTFKEFIIGLAMMEESVATLFEAEQPALLEKRFHFIFRYYDSNSDGFLDRKELLVLLNDYYEKLVSIIVDQSLIFSFLQEENDRQEQVDYLIEKFAANKNEHLGLDLNRAKEAIKYLSKNLESCSTDLPSLLTILYRLPFDVLVFAGIKFSYQQEFDRSIYSSCSQEKYIQKCDSCANNRIFLSNHMVRLSKIGEIVDIVRLEPFSNEVTLSFIVDIPEQDIYLLANDVLIRLQRLATVLFSDQYEQDYENTFDEMLSNLFYQSQGEMFDAIKTIVQAVMDIFAQEPRYIQIQSPCYVFGDLHGNFKDLIMYSHHFWRCSPFFNSSKYLFLGDYVDRGNWGIEVVLFAFCFKILAPHNFFMIRGNHEIREIQEQFSFFTECNNRLSLELWDLFNDCFDRLPVAAVIDEHIFCAHGGIPASVNTFEQLIEIPNPLWNPLQQSIEAWEIFWNDPINAAEVAYLSDDERWFIANYRGFAKNVKRGTAYMFSEEAVDNFCERNGIDFILRAHEVYQDGFYFYARGKVVTVFSSSKYSFLDNSASVLLVAKNRIRVIKIEIND